jgi:hypothetical protein
MEIIATIFISLLLISIPIMIWMILVGTLEMPWYGDLLAAIFIIAFCVMIIS